MEKGIQSIIQSSVQTIIEGRSLRGATHNPIHQAFTRNYDVGRINREPL